MIEEALVRGDPRSIMGYFEVISRDCAAFREWTLAVWTGS